MSGAAGTEGRDRQAGTVLSSHEKTVPLTLDETVPLDPEALEAFILSDQETLHPFRERITDREAEAILLQLTGLATTGDFQRLPKGEQRRLIPILYDNDLSIPQISRLTGAPKSSIARWVD